MSYKRLARPLLLAAVAAAALAGCSTPGTVTPITTAPAATQTPFGLPAITEPEPEPADEAGVTESMRNESLLKVINNSEPTMFYGVPDADVIALAHTVCGRFDAGDEFIDVILMGVEAGYTTDQIGAFVGVSIAAYCTEYKVLLTAE